MGSSETLLTKIASMPVVFSTPLRSAEMLSCTFGFKNFEGNLVSKRQVVSCFCCDIQCCVREPEKLDVCTPKFVDQKEVRQSTDVSDAETV